MTPGSVRELMEKAVWTVRRSRDLRERYVLSVQLGLKALNGPLHVRVHGLIHHDFQDEVHAPFEIETKLYVLLDRRQDAGTYSALS